MRVRSRNPERNTDNKDPEDGHHDDLYLDRNSEAGRCLDEHVYFDVQGSVSHQPLLNFERAGRLEGSSRRAFFWLQSAVLRMYFANGELNVDRSTIPRQINLKALEAGAARERDFHARRNLIFDAIDTAPASLQQAHPLELRAFLFDFFDATRAFEFPSASLRRKHDDARNQANKLEQVSDPESNTASQTSTNTVVIHHNNSSNGVQLDMSNTGSGDVHIHIHVDKLNNISGFPGMAAADVLKAIQESSPS